MGYDVRVSAEVANLGRGSRRRAGRVFSRAWTRLTELPDEVRDDPHLEVREVATDLTELSYNELKSLAAERGVDTGGKKAELIERLQTTAPVSKPGDDELRPERFGEE
jgi:hypothetical protein